MGGPAVGNTPFGDATYFWPIRGPLSLIVYCGNYLRGRGSLPCVGGPPKVCRTEPQPVSPRRSFGDPSFRTRKPFDERRL